MDHTGAAPPAHGFPGLDDLEQRCWQHFLDGSTALLDALNRRLLAGHKLTLFDFLVLDALAKSAGGSARMGDLAQAIVLLPSRLTHLIQGLESQGLVRRGRSRTDGRGVIAAITREGRARLRPAVKTYAEAVRVHYLGQMSRQQLVALGDSCRRISVAVKASARSRRGTGG